MAASGGAGGGSVSGRFVVHATFDAAKFLEEIRSGLVAATNMFTNWSRAMNGLFRAGISPMANGMNQIAASSGKATRNINGVFNATSTGAKAASQEVRKLDADIFTAARRVILWGVASRVTFDALAKAGESVKDFIRLNDTLTDIAKIQPAGFDMKPVRANILATAKEYGVTMEDIAETNKVFFQAGFKSNEVLELTRTQLLGVVAAGLTAEQSTEMLISAMTIFNLKASESQQIVDKLQYTEAKYAVTAQDLAEAFRRVGPIVEELGGNFDHLIGVITAVKQATRKSGEFIGTALSTVFSRITSPDGERVLNNIGVATRETASEYRDLDAILDDLSKKWGSITEAERVNIALQLGQRRRYSLVLSMMDSYKLAMDAMKDSMNSFGEASFAQGKGMMSVQRQFTVASETMRQGAMDVLVALSPGKNVKSTEDALTSLAVSVGKVGDFFTKNADTIAKAVKLIGGSISLMLSYFTGRMIQQRLGQKIGQFGGFKEMLFADYFKEINKIKAAQAIVQQAQAIPKPIVSVGGITTFPSASVMHINSQGQLKLIDNLKAVNKYGQLVQGTVGGVTVQMTKNSAATILAADALNTAAVAGGRFRVAMIGILGILKGTLLGIASTLGAIFISNFVSKLFEAKKNTKIDLSDMFKVPGSKEVEEILKQYASVAKEFKNVGGANSMKAFKEVLATKTSASDIDKIGEILKRNGVDFDVAADKATKYKQAVEKIAVVIGFLQATQGGLRVELDKIEQSFTATTSNLEVLGRALDKVASNAMTTQDFLKQMFGSNYMGDLLSRSKLGFEIEKMSMASMLPDNTVVRNTQELAANFARLVDAGKIKLPKDSWLATLRETPEGLTMFPMILKTLFDSVKTNLAGTGVSLGEAIIHAASVGTGLKELKEKVADAFVVDPETFARLSSNAMAVGFDTNALRARVGGAINLLDSLFTGGTKASQLFETSLRSDFEGIIKTLASIRTEKMGELFTELKSLEDQMVELSKNPGQIGFAVALSELYTKLISYNKELATFNMRLQTNQELASAAGTDKLKAKLSFYDAEIQKSVELKVALNNVDQAMASLIVERNKINQNTAGLSRDFAAEKIDANNKAVLEIEERIKNLKTDRSRLEKDSYDVDARLNVLLAERARIYAQISEYAKKAYMEETQQKSIISFYEKLNENAKSLAEAQAVTPKQKVQANLEFVEREYEIKRADLAIQEAQLALAIERGTISHDEAITQAGQLAVNKEMWEQDKARAIILAQQEGIMAKIKERMEDAKSLAEEYRGVVVDILTSWGQMVTDKKNFGEILSGFGDAWKKMVAESFTKTMKSFFQSWSNVTLGISEDDKKNIATQNAIMMGFDYGARTIYNAIVNAWESATGVRSGGGIAPTTPGATGVKLTEDDLVKRLTKENTESTKKLYSSIRMLSMTLGTAIGGGGAGAQAGASLGGAFGDLAASLLKTSGPVGVLLSTVGSLFGGLLGGKDNEPAAPQKNTLQVIEKNNDALRENTAATIQNTQSFDFMRRLVNAPANFILPSPATIGGGVPSVTVNVYGTDSKDIGGTVYDAVSRAYEDAGRRVGRRG